MTKPARQAQTEKCFAASVLDPSRRVPSVVRALTRRRAGSGLAVHRNNVSASLMSFVAARFPVVRAIAGDESFFARVRQFILMHPPRSPVLLHYGREFPRFVRDLGSEACFNYVADVAQLELARAEAYHAADAVAVATEDFASLLPEQVGALRVSFHPSASLLDSRFPIVSTWWAQQEHNYLDKGSWGAESALIVRPELDVEVWKLPPGGFAFMTSLAGGCSIAEAASAGFQHAATFDFAANLSVLIGARVVTSFG
jgi:hypothetical protein